MLGWVAGLATVGFAVVFHTLTPSNPWDFGRYLVGVPFMLAGAFVGFIAGLTCVLGGVRPRTQVLLFLGAAAVMAAIAFRLFA